MKTVNIHAAKTTLSALIADALGGEEVVIAKNGKPLVRLTPLAERKPSDAFGMDAGLITIAPDFDDTPNVFVDYVE